MAQLPPKMPPRMTQNWPLFPHHTHNSSQAVTPTPPPLPNMAAAPTSNNNADAATHHHNNNPNQHSWVDEFLGFSSTSRGHHRRSMSDGVTFIEMAGALDPLGGQEDHHHHHHHHHHHLHDNISFDRLDDDQLLSMFADDMSLDLPPPASSTALSSPLSTPSEQNSNNEDQMKVSQLSENLQLVDSSSQFSLDSLGLHPSPNGDSKPDPKRVKRILANRLSAQRSRVRKLRYISELEQIVTSLQNEVSALSPRVAFLDHQRLILNVDNSALKQRIAALAQDKLFKDAHQEALKREVERLRQIYQQQNPKNKNDGVEQIINNNNNNPITDVRKPLSSLQQMPPLVHLSTPDMGIACNEK